MTTDDIITALRACVDAMRRSDPVYCAALGVEQIGDVEWDAALALGEDALDALDAVRETA